MASSAQQLLATAPKTTSIVYAVRMQCAFSMPKHYNSMEPINLHNNDYAARATTTVLFLGPSMRRMVCITFINVAASQRFYNMENRKKSHT